MKISQDGRKLGILYGQAVGDALGLSCEFLSRSEVLHHYPNGIHSYSDCIEDRHRSRWRRGQWTDDTDMMLCIRRVSDGSVDSLATAQAFMDWHKAGGMGIGLQSYRTLNLPQYTEYPTKAAELTWKLSREKAAGNGGIMRTSILSAWYADKPFEYLAAQSETLCRLTHFDPRCVGSCVVYNYILWALIEGRGILMDDLVALADRYDSRIAQYVNFPEIDSDISTLKLDDTADMGYTLKALLVSVWALQYATDFEGGLRTVIEQGGDADTNGAVVGALLGAKFGYQSIPPHWLSNLLDGQLIAEFYNINK